MNAADLLIIILRTRVLHVIVVFKGIRFSNYTRKFLQGFCVRLYRTLHIHQNMDGILGDIFIVFCKKKKGPSKTSPEFLYPPLDISNPSRLLRYLA
jgi:hypothetical protein